MSRDNDWFFDKFEHDTGKVVKGFGCLWLIGAALSFLVSIAFIVACVVVILHVCEMPELAEKTPIYDVLVYINDRKPITVASKITYDEAKDIQKQFDWNWPGKYGSSATATVRNILFVLNNVDFVEVKRSQRKNLDAGGRWVEPYWVDRFLEDDDA